MSDFDISGVLRIDTTDLDKVVGRVGGAAKGIAGALAGALAIDKIKDWGLAGLKAAGDFEQSEIAFTSLLRSGEKAQTMLSDLRRFVVSTPFEFPGMADATRKLLGYGFAAKDIIPIMTDIGNAASALGVSEAGINGLVRALGQMKGKGKVSADEIRQISENMPGFNAAATIAAAKGIDVAQVYKLMEKGAIPAAEGIDAILKGLKNFPGAAGAMELQNKTLLGSFNMLKETIRFAAVDVFEPMLPTITKAIRSFAMGINTTIVPALKASSKALLTTARSMKRATQFLRDGDAQGFAEIMDKLLGNSGRLIPVFRGLGQVILDVGEWGGRAFDRLRDHVVDFGSDALGAWNLLVQGFKTPGIILGADAVDDRITRLGAHLRPVVDDMKAFFADFFERLAEGWRHPGLTQGPDAVDDRVTRFSAKIKTLLLGAKRQFELFGMGIRGAITLDDTRPMYELGEAVRKMGLAVQDNGPTVVKFWKDDLYPILERVGIFISDNIVPILGGLGAILTALRVMAIAGSIAAVLGPAITAITAFAGSLSSLGGIVMLLGGPVGIAIAAIGLLVAGVIYAYQHFESFRVGVGIVSAYVQEQFGNLVAFGKEIWPQLSEAIGHVINVIVDYVEGGLRMVKYWWSSYGDDILRIGRGVFTVLHGFIELAINGIETAIRVGLAIINGDWGKAWDAIKSSFESTKDSLIKIGTGLVDALIGVLGGAYQEIKDVVTGKIFKPIVDTLKDLFEIHSPSKVLERIGWSIIDGLVQGITNTAHKVIDAIKNNVTDKLPDFVTKAWDSHSPSRLFAKIGRSVPEGMAQGILSGVGDVSAAMGAITNVPDLAYSASGAAAAGGSNSPVVINGDIIVNGADNPYDPGWQPQLVSAIQAGVGRRQ